MTPNSELLILLYFHLHKFNMFLHVSGLGCGSSVLTVLVCAIGQKQLKDRVNLFNKFRTAKINVDHCHCLVSNYIGR